jgi:hypothetical protein
MCLAVESACVAPLLLQEVAERVGAPLVEVPSLDAWQSPQGGPVSVGLGGEHQRVNAGLAVQMCATFEQESLATARAAPGAKSRVAALMSRQLPPEYLEGLAATTWPGRSQVGHHQCKHSNEYSSRCTALCIVLVCIRMLGNARVKPQA